MELSEAAGQPSWLERQWFGVLREVEEVEARVQLHYARHDDAELWALVHCAISTRQDPVHLLRQLVDEGKAQGTAVPDTSGLLPAHEEPPQLLPAPVEPQPPQPQLARRISGGRVLASKHSVHSSRPAWALVVASGWAGRILARAPLVHHSL
jgi:hypothetical protein